MALRSSWEGFLKLNLLSVPVKAYSATVSARGKISFNQLHANCGERIRYQKVCPVHGDVTKDEIVPGYQYAKRQYVVVLPDEMDKLRTENDKAINIDVFIQPKSLDPVFYSGRSYYLVPDGKVGEKPYAVLQRVMNETDRFAVARVVISNREQLALLRPIDGVLVMTLLTYDAQVRKPAAVKDEIPDVEPAAKEIELAEALVKASTAKDFDFSKYEDEYEAKLAKLIEAKAKGKEIVGPERTEEPAVINLMDALRKSLNQTGKHARTAKSSRKPRRRKTA